MSLLPLILAVFASSADAAPHKDQVHLQLQTGLLSRSSLHVDETDFQNRTTGIGAGAGGVALTTGYQFRAPSEVGVRLEMARVTQSDGTDDLRQSNFRLAGLYTHSFRVDSTYRLTATGLLGLERSDWDGDAIARAPFLGLGAGVQYFATPRTALSAGLEATRTLGGRFEQDGLDGSSRFSNSEIAAVIGMNVYLGGSKGDKRSIHTKKPAARRP